MHRRHHRQDLFDRLPADLDARDRVLLVVLAHGAGLVAPSG
ncbi:hypothetical protein ABGB12_11485 [Actinocorallia sp. B10E7]